MPYSGKTSLFCALTSQDYESLGHGRDIHIGTVKVPDVRLDMLTEIIKPKKYTYATMEFFDIAGQSAGTDKVIEPKSLQALKNAESLIVILDAFNVGAEPKKDFTTLMEEFAFNDLVVASNRLDRLQKDMKSGKHVELVRENEVLERCREVLENGEALRDTAFEDHEEKLLRGFQFLTLKPLLIVINIPEDALNGEAVAGFEAQFADVRNSKCAALCVELEMEIAMLDEADRPAFLETMNIEEPALARLIRLSYETLGLFSFFTAGDTEVRAWNARKGALAPECAGVIHSDMERGFIRAETVAYDDFVRAGSYSAARDQGLLRVEGKDYVVDDGDILTIRFSV